MTITIDTHADDYITAAQDVGDQCCWRAPSDLLNQIIIRQNLGLFVLLFQNF